MVTEWLHLFFEPVGDILSNRQNCMIQKQLHIHWKKTAILTACTATLPLFKPLYLHQKHV